MARSKSSKAWLRRHVNDPYVHRAKAQGYRSRSAYKLIEIAKRDKLARPGDDVVDLGAAPGGWAQALAERVGRSGRVIAVDLLEIAPIRGVSATDQARSIHLCELALEFARSHLKPDGAFLVKVFQGTGYPEFLAAMRGAFVEVASRKPGASRAGSNEMYLLGKRLRSGH